MKPTLLEELRDAATRYFNNTRNSDDFFKPFELKPARLTIIYRGGQWIAAFSTFPYATQAETVKHDYVMTGEEEAGKFYLQIRNLQWIETQPNATSLEKEREYNLYCAIKIIEDEILLPKNITEMKLGAMR